MPEPDLRGRTLADRYRIDERLGEGGMAVAWLAFDRNLARQVVVKVPFPDLLRVESFAQRFELEIRSLIQLAHPHVVHILDVGTVDGLPYCVLEYLGGGSLSERLSRGSGRQSIAEVLTWLPAIATALDHVHEEGMIHRDVKPGNILFDEKGNPALSDFGIVKACEQAREGLTATGQSPGSPGYMAPEILGGGVGPAYDQYSLAAVVFRCVTGSAPKPLQARVELLQIGAGTLPLPTISVLQTALSPEPEARFRNCAQFAEAFAATAADASTAVDAIPTVAPVQDRPEDATATFVLPTQTPPAPEHGKPAKRGKWALVAVLGVVLLALGAGAAALLPRDPAGDDRATRPDETPTAPHAAPSDAVADVTAPVISLEPVAAFTRRNRLEIAGRVVDEHRVELLVAGRRVPVSPNGSFYTDVDLAEGPNTVRVEAADAAGNRAEPLSVEVLLDTEDPVLTIDGDRQRFSRTGEIEVRGTLRDAHPHCVRIGERRIEVGPDGSFSHRLEIPDGRSRHEVYGCDRSGNETERVVIRVTTDREAPRLVVQAPEDGLVTREGRIVVLARLVDPHASSLTIAGIEAERAGSSGFRAEVALEEGPNRIELCGADEAGNETRQTIEVTRDTHPPELSVEPPERGDEGCLLVRGRIVDANPGHVLIAGVRVDPLRDGTFLHRVEPGDAGRELALQAVDLAGNRGEAVTVPVPVEGPVGGPPPVVRLDPLPARTEESSVVVSGRVEPDTCTVTVNGNATEVRDGRFTCRLSLPEGEIEIAVEARRAGSNPTRVVHRIVRDRKPVEPPPAVAALLSKLGSRDAGERFFAATGLGRTAFKPAAEALEKVLRDDPDRNVRRAAARSLAQLDSWRSVPALIDALESGKPLVAGDANAALKKITGQDFGYRAGMSADDAAESARKGREWWAAHRGDRAQ